MRPWTGLGLAGALVVGAAAAPAAAQEQRAVFVDSVSDGGSCTVSGRITGFPPLESLQAFVLFKQEDGSSAVYQGVSLSTGPDGSAGPTAAVPIFPPNTVDSAVYRDLNRNNRWDPDVDDTLFRGDAHLETCGGTAQLTSK